MRWMNTLALGRKKFSAVGHVVLGAALPALAIKRAFGPETRVRARLVLVRGASGKPVVVHDDGGAVIRDGGEAPTGGLLLFHSTGGLGRFERESFPNWLVNGVAAPRTNRGFELGAGNVDKAGFGAGAAAGLSQARRCSRAH